MCHDADAVDRDNQIVADAADLPAPGKLHHALMQLGEHLEAYHLALLQVALARDVPQMERLALRINSVIGRVEAGDASAGPAVVPCPLFAMDAELLPADGG